MLWSPCRHNSVEICCAEQLQQETGEADTEISYTTPVKVLSYCMYFTPVLLFFLNSGVEMVYKSSFEGSLTHSLQSKKFFAASVLEKELSLKIFTNHFTSQLFLSV